jgi:adenylate kinase
MLNIVIFGAPGTGKGTQSGLLIEKYHLVHLSTGDLLREAISQGTPLGLEAKKFIDQGLLVPDEVILGEVKQKILRCSTCPGLVFDGFPRTQPQAQALDAMLEEIGSPIQLVVTLDVDEDELFKRILHRATLSARTDDNEETIRKRIDVYKAQSLPLIEYYEKQGECIHIDGMRNIDEVFADISGNVDYFVK